MTNPAPADVLVVFGITGDLAKVMTFHSLYRLEARGLLDCPIVGVAVDDWTVDQLVERARESIEGTGEQLDAKVFDRFAARLSYVQGDFGDAATYERVGKAIEGASTPGLLPRDPALPLRHGRQGPRRGRPDEDGPRRRREAVRPRPGLGPRARRRAAPVHRRVAALPDRPLPREDGPRGDPLPALREHDARAGLEPELRRVRRRSRWPRTSASRTAATSTTRSARCATSSSTTSCRWSPRPRWSRRRAATRRRSRTGWSPSSAPSREADPAHYVRGQHDGYLDVDGVAPEARRPRRTRPCASTSTTGAGPAFPSSSARASCCRSCRPRSGSSSSIRRSSASRRSSPSAEPDQFVIKLDPSTACSSSSTPCAPTHGKAEPITLDMEFAEEGGEGATPYEVLLARGDGRPEHALHPPGRRRGDVADHAAAARRAAAVHPYAPGSWGPEAADELVAGPRRWHGPWVTP